MTSQPGQQTSILHILPSILRSRGNQTMKFGQLIECNMRKNFLEKSYTKSLRKTSPRHFSGKLKMSISLTNALKFYTVCFYCMASLGLSKSFETKLQTTCFYLTLSNFKKK